MGIAPGGKCEATLEGEEVERWRQVGSGTRQLLVSVLGVSGSRASLRLFSPSGVLAPRMLGVRMGHSEEMGERIQYPCDLSGSMYRVQAEEIDYSA